MQAVPIHKTLASAPISRVTLWTLVALALSVPTFGQSTFSVAVVPSSQSVSAGSSTTYSVSVTDIGGGGANTYSASQGTLAGRAVKVPCATCPSGFKVSELLGHAPAGKGTVTFNGIIVPSDGNYDITWVYFCGKSDNNGDATCGGQPHTASGCRPGIFVVNGVQLPGVNQFQCFPGTWQEVHTQNFSVPLKAGTNSLKIFSNSADCPDLDRIMVPNGTGGGGTETVSLSVSGLPAGATAAFAPGSITGSATSTLTISTTTAVTPATYPITVTGTFGSETETASASLVVTPPGDFSVSAIPSSQTIDAGSSGTYTATVAATGGFSGAVNLSVTGLPAGTTATFNPATVTGGGTSTLTVSVGSTTPSGTSTLTITGTSGNVSHGTTVGLVVPTGQPPVCVSTTKVKTFTNTPFTAQSGTFTAQFDATPGAATTINDVIGLSSGAQTSVANFPVLVSFSDSGHIVARNDGAYAATNIVPVVAGNTYHFRLVVNVAAHTYSIFVTPSGGTEVTVGSNFAFRTGVHPASLNSVGSDVDSTAGSLKYCSFTVN